MIKVFEEIGFYTRFYYSKFFNKNDITKYRSGIRIISIDRLEIVLKNLYKNNFVYKKDYIDELHTPAQCCKDLIEGKLYDDCDGWCAAIYHILHENEIECWINTTIYKNAGHCFIVFKYDNKYYILDYINISGPFNSIKQVDNYIKNVKYKNRYSTHIYTIYDYNKNKYQNIKPKNMK